MGCPGVVSVRVGASQSVSQQSKELATIAFDNVVEWLGQKYRMYSFAIDESNKRTEPCMMATNNR